MKVKRLLVFLIVIIFLINLAYFYPKLTGKGVYGVEIVNITKIIDGDTVEAGIDKVRLLCINTPEKGKPFCEEAENKLVELQGREAGVLRDKTDEDRYNRKLRYIFYQGRFINKEILEQGLAHIYLCEGLKYEKELRKAEETARKAGMGIWRKSRGKCRDCIELIELNAEEEYFILKNKCRFPCLNLEVKDEARHFFDINMAAKEEKKIESKGKIWNDGGDSLFLRDNSGLLLYFHY